MTTRLLEHHGLAACPRCTSIGSEPVCRRCLSLTLGSAGWALFFVVTDAPTPAWLGVLPLLVLTDWLAAHRQPQWYAPRRVWATSIAGAAPIGATIAHLSAFEWWAPATPWALLALGLLLFGALHLMVRRARR